MPMFNLLYSSKNFRKTAGSSWNYYPYKPNSGYNNNNRDKDFYSIKDSETFDYKSKLINVLDSINENANNVVTTESEEIKIIVPLKNLSNFIFRFDFLMISTEIELILKWSENCLLTGKATRNEIVEGDDPVAEPEINAIYRPKDLKFNITDCKLYVLVFTLQEKYENELYKN